MKFSVGYQLGAPDGFLEEIVRQKARVAEVYFSWGDMPNGRAPANARADMTAWEAGERQTADLTRLHGEGLRFNLLFNGNCYGRRALSKALLTEVCDTADMVGSRWNLVSATTTSPVIARCLRRNFPGLDVRASVNMEIGTPRGMDYVADCFDSYYLRRECNRDREAIRAARAWCDANGKRLYMLANSGCLADCSARQFHDNLVSHERGIGETDNAVAFRGVCADYLDRTADKSALLRELSFVRPEDVPLYEGLFEGAKLATRVSRYPARILRAYCEGRCAGNLLDLLEPDHAERLYPDVIENGALPADFGARTSVCGRACGGCGYCRAAFEGALRHLSEDSGLE